MSAPAAFLALWNSVRADRQAEYEIWHSFEHVPERTGLPGFVEARRYRAHHEPLQYFTWYGVLSLAAFESDGYRDVMAHPTPWSARMRPVMGDFLRMPCTLLGRHGTSTAAHLAVWVIDIRPDCEALAGDCLATGREHLGVARTDWGLLADMGSYAVPVLAAQASNATSIPAQGPRWVVLMQGLEPAALLDTAQAVATQMGEWGTLVRPVATYGLLSITCQNELPARDTPRPPPRADLLEPFVSGDTP